MKLNFKLSRHKNIHLEDVGGQTSLHELTKQLVEKESSLKYHKFTLIYQGDILNNLNLTLEDLKLGLNDDGDDSDSNEVVFSLIRHENKKLTNPDDIYMPTNIYNIINQIINNNQLYPQESGNGTEVDTNQDNIISTSINYYPLTRSTGTTETSSSSNNNENNAPNPINPINPINPSNNTNNMANPINGLDIPNLLQQNLSTILQGRTDLISDQVLTQLANSLTNNSLVNGVIMNPYIGTTTSNSTSNSAGNSTSNLAGNSTSNSAGNSTSNPAGNSTSNPDNNINLNPIPSQPDISINNQDTSELVGDPSPLEQTNEINLTDIRDIEQQIQEEINNEIITDDIINTELIEIDTVDEQDEADLVDPGENSETELEQDNREPSDMASSSEISSNSQDSELPGDVNQIINNLNTMFDTLISQNMSMTQITTDISNATNNLRQNNSVNHNSDQETQAQVEVYQDETLPSPNSNPNPNPNPNPNSNSTILSGLPDLSNLLTNTLTTSLTNQVDRLVEMGYSDTELNRLALESCDLNLNQAIEWIENLR